MSFCAPQSDLFNYWFYITIKGQKPTMDIFTIRT